MRFSGFRVWALTLNPYPGAPPEPLEGCVGGRVGAQGRVGGASLLRWAQGLLLCPQQLLLRPL
jgi:hypothetical protein